MFIAKFQTRNSHDFILQAGILLCKIKSKQKGGVAKHIFRNTQFHGNLTQDLQTVVQCATVPFWLQSDSSRIIYIHMYFVTQQFFLFFDFLLYKKHVIYIRISSEPQQKTSSFSDHILLKKDMLSVNHISDR